jgi:hypothetical protein
MIAKVLEEALRRSSAGWSLSRLSGMNGHHSDKLIDVIGSSLRWSDGGFGRISWIKAAIPISWRVVRMARFTSV